MSQRRVVGTESRNFHTERTCSSDNSQYVYTQKRSGDAQEHVAVTRPLLCGKNFKPVQHELYSRFVPATCCTEFNSLNFMVH